MEPFSPVNLHILRALAHAGSYVVGAFDGGRMVGASAGFVGLDPELHLHSHITGVAPEAQGRSIGYALKQYQREWCLARDIPAITWTFDPLVRRNAWFNLQRLGAEFVAFHEDFYGDMTDGLNAGDRTDRFVVRWDVRGAAPRAIVPPNDAVLFNIPDDIVALRETHPERARDVRYQLRVAMEGRRVLGITRDGDYVLVAAP